MIKTQTLNVEFLTKVVERVIWAMIDLTLNLMLNTVIVLLEITIIK